MNDIMYNLAFALWEDHFYISPPHILKSSKTGALVEVVRDKIKFFCPTLARFGGVEQGSLCMDICRTLYRELLMLTHKSS